MSYVNFVLNRHENKKRFVNVFSREKFPTFQVNVQIALKFSTMVVRARVEREFVSSVLYAEIC